MTSRAGAMRGSDASLSHGKPLDHGALKSSHADELDLREEEFQGGIRRNRHILRGQVACPEYNWILEK